MVSYLRNSGFWFSSVKLTSRCVRPTSGRVLGTTLIAAAYVFAASPARAVGVTPTLLDEVSIAGGSLTASTLGIPVIDQTGTVYWSRRIDPSSGGNELLSSISGVLAADARTQAQAGDFPLLGVAADARSGQVLLQGFFFEPSTSGSGGFFQTVGLYRYPGLTRLAYFNSAFPSFSSSVDLQISAAEFDSDGSAVFQLRDVTNFLSIEYAICRVTGGVVTILARSGVTPVPGGVGETFTLFDSPVVNQGVVLFYGEALGIGRRGVYQINNGTISVVVDNTTILPGNTSPAFILDKSDVSFSNEGTDVAVALRASGGGVFKRVGGAWSRVIASNAPIPGGVGVFFDFFGPAIRNGKVLFLGFRNNTFSPPVEAGIYTDAGGAVDRIVDLTDDFGASTPSFLEIARGGRFFNGIEIAFAARSASSWRGVFRMTVPGLSADMCGRPVGTGSAPVASDALFVLNAAVGSQGCAPCVCNVDSSGGGSPVTATDALLVLQKAVGQPISLSCPAC